MRWRKNGGGRKHGKRAEQGSKRGHEKRIRPLSSFQLSCDLLRRVNQASGKKWVHAYDKKTKDVRAAFPDFHHENFGYVLTDMALEDILRQTKARSGAFQCDTLTFTNADNLYSPHFIPAMLKSIACDGHDLVASHFVSHYSFPAERSTRSFEGILASESGCGPLLSGILPTLWFSNGLIIAASFALHSSSRNL